MEWLEVFDKDENILNKKVVRGSNLESSEYVMVVYLFIQNDEGKILLESNAKDLKWVVPGGHVTDGLPIDNIKREMKEELNLEIETGKLKEIATLCKNNHLFKLYFLDTNVNLNALNLQKEEVNKVEFFTLEQIENMIKIGNFRQNNVMFIDSLKKFLGGI